jgi:hypothetical protein
MRLIAREKRGVGMATPHAIASYLPESMLIKIGPDLIIFDPDAPGIFPTAFAFGFFFHEYAHFLHNISTVSGVAVVINTIELWRCFRQTIDAAGNCGGSGSDDAARKNHLQTLISYLSAARQNHRPLLKTIASPVSVTITSVTERSDVQGTNQEILSVLECDAIVSDQGGQTENSTIRIGTLELLESAAWLLEKRMVTAINPQETISPPPVFPYHIVEALADYAAPGLEEEGVLACVLAALQSSDAPQALKEILEIARQAVQSGHDPVTALRQSTLHALNQGADQLEQVFGALEAEFSNDGVLARAIRRIISAARQGFELRRVDPFFELRIIENIGSRSWSLKNVIRQIPSCAVLQIRPDDENHIGRDILSSFLPNADEYGQDPEAGLRVVHSVFDYVGRHRTKEGLTTTQQAQRGSCPFYTCCDLSLRKKEPDVCRNTPWKSADWPDWDRAGSACCYGTAVRITRPPKK